MLLLLIVLASPAFAASWVSESNIATEIYYEDWAPGSEFDWTWGVTGGCDTSSNYCDANAAETDGYAAGGGATVDDINVHFKTYYPTAPSAITFCILSTTAAKCSTDGYKIATNSSNYLAVENIAGGTIVSGTPTINATTWYDINATRDSVGIWRIYLDDALVATSAAPNQDYNTNDYVSIDTQHINMRMDELLIYSQNEQPTIYEPATNGFYNDTNMHLKYNLETAGNCNLNITDTYPGTDANIVFTGTVTGNNRNVLPNG